MASIFYAVLRPDGILTTSSLLNPATKLNLADPGGSLRGPACRSFEVAESMLDNMVDRYLEENRWKECVEARLLPDLMRHAY